MQYNHILLMTTHEARWHRLLLLIAMVYTCLSKETSRMTLSIKDLNITNIEMRLNETCQEDLAELSNSLEATKETVVNQLQELSRNSSI